MKNINQLDATGLVELSVEEQSELNGGCCYGFSYGYYYGGCSWSYRPTCRPRHCDPKPDNNDDNNNTPPDPRRSRI